MAFMNTVDIVGDEALIDSYLSGAITEFRANYHIFIGNYGFIYCGSLAVVDLVDCPSIGNYGFNACSALKQLILRGSEMTALLHTNCLSQTPIKTGAGYIYVPAALLAGYQAATNWSTYAAQFRALEDYTVDGTIMGDLDETKI